MSKASAALLAAYTFLLTTTLRLGCTDLPESIYYAQQAALALGFLSFALSRRILREPKPRKALAAVAITAYAVVAAPLLPAAMLAAFAALAYLLLRRMEIFRQKNRGLVSKPPVHSWC